MSTTRLKLQELYTSAQEYYDRTSKPFFDKNESREQVDSVLSFLKSLAGQSSFNEEHKQQAQENVKHLEKIAKSIDSTRRKLRSGFFAIGAKTGVTSASAKFDERQKQLERNIMKTTVATLKVGCLYIITRVENRDALDDNLDHTPKIETKEDLKNTLLKIVNEYKGDKNEIRVVLKEITDLETGGFTDTEMKSTPNKQVTAQEMMAAEEGSDASNAQRVVLGGYRRNPTQRRHPRKTPTRRHHPRKTAPRTRRR